jgi:hypothetical protein
MEGEMSTGEIAVLALIISAFIIFGAALFWASRGSGSAITLDERRPPQRNGGTPAAHFPSDSAFIVDD